MKKILMAIMICLVTGAAFAQQYTGPWDESIPKDCFCCNSIYNLPTKPPIYGSDTFSCNGVNAFSTTKCSSANYNWTVTPAIAFNGQGTNTITLSAPTTGVYTICVIISCGTKSVKNCRTVKATCCDCSKLPKQFSIQGPLSYCKGTNCADLLTYTAPNLGDAKCFTHHWSVQPMVNYGGNNNQLLIKCSALSAGTYTITDTIFCNGGGYSISKVQLTVCQKLDPTVSYPTNSANVSTITFTSNISPTGNCHNAWYFFEDNIQNCLHDGNASEPVTQAQIGGNTFTATGLLAGHHYVLHHYVICDCGGQPCISFQPQCIVVPPQPSMIKQGNSNNAEQKIIVTKGIEELSQEKIQENLKQMEISAQKVLRN